MTATQADIDAILKAIDGGDDLSLLGLADAYEEAGDPVAAGLRKVYASDRRPKYYADEKPWHWYACHPMNHPHTKFMEWVSLKIIGQNRGTSDHIYFDSRSEALIFLAKKFVEKGLA